MDLLKLYGRIAVLATKRATQAWVLVPALILYVVIVSVALRLTAPLGQFAGFILPLVTAACLSSYLHLLSAAVAGRPIRWLDLKGSFGARFWDAVSVMFAFWVIAFLIKALSAGAGDQGIIIVALANLAMAVFFNPALEFLYQSDARSFAVLAAAARFISRQGLEWLVPNISFTLAMLAAAGLLHGPPGQIVLLAAAALMPAAAGSSGLWLLFGSASLPLAAGLLIGVHWIMIFRGLLFQALHGRIGRPRGPWPGMGRN